MQDERVECRAFLDRVAVESNSDSDRPCSQTLDVKQNALAKKRTGGTERGDAADREREREKERQTTLSELPKNTMRERMSEPAGHSFTRSDRPGPN